MTRRKRRQRVLAHGFSFQARYLVIAVMMATSGAVAYVYFNDNGLNPVHGSGMFHTFQMSVDSVSNYGFYYPVTFTFTIPSGSSGLKAVYRYAPPTWIALTEKNKGDDFNGIDCVRFDYTNNKAYVSVGFKGHTQLNVEVTSGSGFAIETSFDGVAKYYDNRVCAVTSHHDDYGGGSPDLALMDMFQARRLWYGAAAITSSANWAGLQTQVNEGYVEVESHSVDHPSTILTMDDASAWNEIKGSHDAILSHVNNLPYGQYVLVMIFPYSWMSDRERMYCGKAGYIVDEADPMAGTIYQPEIYRAWYTPTYKGETYGIFPETYAADLGTHGSGGTDLAWLNSQFDLAYNQGAIYEVRSHPITVDLNAAYCSGHLDYIANHKDCWYAPLGWIYAYHYVSLFVQHMVTNTQPQ